MVAGCELARRGVAVRVIDKLAQPTDQSRAIAVHARSLDMFDRMGIVDEMLGTGVKAIAMQMHSGGRDLFRVPFGEVDSAFPFTLTTAQTETERVLNERLQSFGVTVERGVELIELSQDDDGVHLTLQEEGRLNRTGQRLLGDRRRRCTQRGAKAGWHQACWFVRR